MECTPLAQVRAMAKEWDKPVYLVRVSSPYNVRGLCDEECVTTVKAEADHWAKQWKQEYPRADGYSHTFKIIKGE